MKAFPVLYKIAKTGSPQQWQIIVEGNQYYTLAGQVGGIITKSEPTVCEPKNIGRANATTAEQQAEAEAAAKHQKKIDKGYVTDINNASNGPDYYECMLAHKYEDHMDKLSFPLFVQRKSDGIRAIITANGATTRNGKQHMCIPHILEALKPVFKADPTAVFDGELYNHDLHDNFNKISSLIRKAKPTIEDLFEAQDLVQFHCYDAPRIGNLNEKDSFHSRYTLMMAVLEPIGSMIKVVNTYKVNNHESIKEYHEKFVAEGYEGIMVRVNGSYQNKRSKNLLKYKTFDTDEFIIENILPGKGNKSNMAGCVEMHSKSGEYFTCNIKAPHDVLETMLIQKNLYVGKTATVRYFGLTPDKKIPRFPYVVETDRWSYE